MTPQEALVDLLNSLDIIGPNIIHAEWLPDAHMPVEYPGPGWCLCDRALPCEAQAVTGAIALALTEARAAERERLRNLIAIDHAAHPIYPTLSACGRCGVAWRLLADPEEAQP